MWRSVQSFSFASPLNRVYSFGFLPKTFLKLQSTTSVQSPHFHSPALFSPVLAGQRHPEEDRPWDPDAGRRLQAAGRLLSEGPGAGGGQESADLQHPHHGLHVGAAEDEGGPGHAERHAEVVGRGVHGRPAPLQRKSGHFRQDEMFLLVKPEANIRLVCLNVKSRD